MIDRHNAGSSVGKKLLALSDELFHDWHRYKEGKQSRRWLVQRMEGLRQRVSRALQRGVASGCAKTARTCRELLGHESWLWTFAEVAGVEPTNNSGERALSGMGFFRQLFAKTTSTERQFWPKLWQPLTSG